MEISFKGKTALVSGATKGIGREIAKRLAQHGAAVLAIGRSQKDLDSLKEEFPSIRTMSVDLNNWNVTRDALKDVNNIDLLVNNAAVAILEPILDISEDNIDRSFAVNVKTTINLTQLVAKSLIERKAPGSIVNISSQASMQGIAEHAVYCSTKGAVDAFSKVAALELGPHNIRVNCVNPTVVLTEMGKIGWSDPAKADPLKNKIPLRRFAEVSEVVDAVMYLLSDKASMINGSCLPVDGGCLAVL